MQVLCVLISIMYFTILYSLYFPYVDTVQNTSEMRECCSVVCVCGVDSCGAGMGLCLGVCASVVLGPRSEWCVGVC